MSRRTLYIAAYDVSDDRRLRAAHRVLKAYASSWQKSVFECLLSPDESRALLGEIGAVIDPIEDRFVLVRLDQRADRHDLGRAAQAARSPWVQVG